DRRQSDPAEAIERNALAPDVRQQEQARHAKAKRGDVPRREAGLEAQASHHDPSGPDADGSEAIEGAADIFGSTASTDSQLGHGSPLKRIGKQYVDVSAGA